MQCVEALTARFWILDISCYLLISSILNGLHFSLLIRDFKSAGELRFATGHLLSRCLGPFHMQPRDLPPWICTPHAKREAQCPIPGRDSGTWNLATADVRFKEHWKSPILVHIIGFHSICWASPKMAMFFLVFAEKRIPAGGRCRRSRSLRGHGHHAKPWEVGGGQIHRPSTSIDHIEMTWTEEIWWLIHKLWWIYMSCRYCMFSLDFCWERGRSIVYKLMVGETLILILSLYSVANPWRSHPEWQLFRWKKTLKVEVYYTAGWWFGTFLIFPYIGNNHPNWLIFFRGVQTTNQRFITLVFATWICCYILFVIHFFSHHWAGWTGWRGKSWKPNHGFYHGCYDEMYSNVPHVPLNIWILHDFTWFYHGETMQNCPLNMNI